MAIPLSAILPGLLIAASFAGLCAALRVRLRISPFIAPMTAVSGIIVSLMLAGMLGVLKIAAYCLYILGILGLLYACIYKRSAPHWGVLALFVLFASFLVFRFHASMLRHYDDFTHWGVIVSHLLRHDRFPAAQDAAITFQSYPPGAACFIYYVARAVGNYEGVYLIAQNFMLGVFFLPIFALIGRRKRVLYPAAIALFVFYFHYACADSNLLVDNLLSFYGIGLTATAFYYRDDPKQALTAVLPAMFGVVYIKNSGMFFAVVTAAVIAYFAWQNGRRSKRFVWLLISSPILCYLVWELFIKFHFPSALRSNHAISLYRYARELYHKDFGTIFKVIWAMITAFFQIGVRKGASLAIVGLCLAALLAGSRSFSAEQRKACLRCCLFAAAVYLAWYIMILCTYMLSMNGEEALKLAGFDRYDPTGYSYVTGIFVIIAIHFLQKDIDFTPLQRRVAAAIPLLGTLAVLLLAIIPNNVMPVSAFYMDEHTFPEIRIAYRYLHDTYDLPAGGSYIIFHKYSPVGSRVISNVGKLELETTSLYLIRDLQDDPDQYQAGEGWKRDPCGDVPTLLRDAVETADAILLLDYSPAFEEDLKLFLDNHEKSPPPRFIERMI